MRTLFADSKIQRFSKHLTTFDGITMRNISSIKMKLMKWNKIYLKIQKPQVFMIGFMVLDKLLTIIHLIVV